MKLAPLPETFASTREALHAVGERIVAPARKPDNEIALMATPGGFGTPPFELAGERLQVRVEDVELVFERDGAVERAPLESLNAAARLLGPGCCPAARPRIPAGSRSTRSPPRRLADFYVFSGACFDTFARAWIPARGLRRSILWPEHFDIALEAGAEEAGLRANYGASPGDEQHAEPYLYVGPWTAGPQGELWNASAFNGAEIGYADLLDGGDPAAAALDFFTARHRALRADLSSASPAARPWPMRRICCSRCDSACSPGAGTARA